MGALTLVFLATGTSAQVATPPTIDRGLTGYSIREPGALLVEDFGAPEVDTERWRIWHSDPDAVSFAVEDGRFVIRGSGPLGHNGLWSLDAARMKDVALVGRMDIRSTRPETHDVLLHLCGGDSPRSPDHWVELSMRDLGDGNARFGVMAALPKGHHDGQARTIDLPRGEKDGYVARVSLDGSSNTCTAEVRDSEGEWHVLTNATRLLLRTTHCEIKMRQRYPGPQADDESVGWFDDVRIYPRADQHPVMVRLRTAGGQHIFSRGETGHEWPPKIIVGDGPPGDLEDLTVELWTANGETQVCAVQSNNLGDYMLPLNAAPWDVYPVSATIRLRLGDRDLGQVTIPVEGLSGLYPDAVLDLTVE